MAHHSVGALFRKRSGRFQAAEGRRAVWQDPLSSANSFRSLAENP